MIPVTKVKNKREVAEIIQNLQQNLAVEKRLFASEVRISICYCDSLFEAGIFSRLECDRIKNGLQTLIKRADFDKTYFDATDAKNIFQFLDRKISNLVGENGSKLQLGRNITDRFLTALRFWLREEISGISKNICEIQTNFVEIAEQNKEEIFLLKESGKFSKPILFAHWCLANFEICRNDRERLDEVWRRVNTMTLGSNDGTGTSLEFDRDELAAKLGFERITVNSLEAVRNQDFILEFVNSVCLISNHLLASLKEISDYRESGFFEFESDIKL